MTGLGFAIGALLAAFQAEEINLPSPRAFVFAAPIEAGKGADLCVLSEQRLEIYRDARLPRAFELVFPAGASAFDVFDLDGDGTNEVLAVTGEGIVEWKPRAGSVGEPANLFEVETVLQNAEGEPYPHVMGVIYEGRRLLALPRADDLALFSREGALVRTFALVEHGRARPGIDAPFTVSPVYPPQVAPAGELEFRVSAARELEAALPRSVAWRPVDALLERPTRPVKYQGPPARMSDFFPLRTNADPRFAALYASDNDTPDTIVRIAVEDLPGADEPVVTVGAPKHYPGKLVVPMVDWAPGVEPQLPDFNADTYTDLVLWSAPEPAMSIDALTRAATAGDWPLRLAVYLFSPETRRYEARPHDVIELRVPLAWFPFQFLGTPIRSYRFPDLNGDGHSDFACTTAANEFSAWVYDDGFPKRPSFRVRTAEPIDEFALVADLNDDGRDILCIRAGNALEVIRLED